MPTRPPPPRYRVVERGRRLEVIDTLTGQPVRTPAPALPAGPAASRWPTLPEPEGFDGRALLVTYRWYDARAPRRIHLDPGTMQWIGAGKAAVVASAVLAIVAAVLAPAALGLLLVPVALLRGSGRERLRDAATAWLDRLDEPRGG